MKRNIIVLTSLIILAALSRFIPHGYNFTPIGGMALLGGAYFNKKWMAVLVPLVVLFLTDFILNNVMYRAFFPDQEGIIFVSKFMIFTYLGTATIVLLGATFLKKVTAPRLLGGALSASLIFFLITNFGSWLTGPMYVKSFAGLMTAYTAGLPFLSGHLIANIVFSFILFGAYELLVNRELSALSRMSL